MDPDTHRFFLDYRLKLLDGQTISAVVYDNELFAEEDIRKLFPDVTTSQGSVETKLQQIIYNQNLLLKDSVNQNEKLALIIDDDDDDANSTYIISDTILMILNPHPCTFK